LATPPSPRALILAVDDDASVGRAVERDLRHRYGARHRVLLADSGETGLGVVEQVVRRGEPVALLVVDQRMPGMSGVEFLARALKLAPHAKRVLLTAYADTEAAIRAINELRLDQYLMKPWDPPEERLYPVLDELLEDWEADAAARVSEPGLRLVGHRFSAEAHTARDFLARNGIPYRWLDVADPEACRLMAAARLDGSELPVLVLEDGEALVRPSQSEVATRIGLRTQAELPFYDLVIVGGGPAGLAAAVYAASEGLKTILVEQEAPGGQAGTTSRIENYLGFPAGLSGGDLARRGLAQARRLGAEILSPDQVTGITRTDPYRVVTLAAAGEISCQTVVVATGVSYRQLELPGADVFAGAGIYYGAATTEAVLYRDKEVGVVGGGNSAGQAAVYLSRFAKRVLVMVRTPALSGMSQYLIDQMAAIPNVEIRFETSVTAVRGEGHLASVTAAGPGGDEELELAAIFVFIGQQPRTDWLEGTVQRDPGGFVITGSGLVEGGKPPAGWGLSREPFLLESSMPGVFVAGDVRQRSVKRIASAVGEGAMAVQFVHQYLAGL
jgi:thioredoxin reductase (NADPH)